MILQERDNIKNEDEFTLGPVEDEFFESDVDLWSGSEDFDSSNEEASVSHQSEVEDSQKQSSRKRKKSVYGKEAKKIRIEDLLVSLDEKVVSGKSGYLWTTRTSLDEHDSNLSEEREFSGCVKVLSDNPLGCFSQFLTDDLLDIIIRHTNKEIAAQKTKFVKKQSIAGNVSLSEMKAFLSIIILCGATKTNGFRAELLEDDSLCGYRFKATMPHDRFNFIINHLRFHDNEFMDVSNVDNDLAPIKEIWDMLIQNCKHVFTPGYHCTIDEYILPFKGNCPFRVHKSYLVKTHGIKFIMLCDSETNYLLDAVIFKGVRSPKESKAVTTAQHYVEEITKSVRGTMRNLTINNWMCSVALAENMLKAHNLTVVGTALNKSKDFPDEFFNRGYKDRGLQTSLFLHSKTSEVKAVSYVPKESYNKLIPLITTVESNDINKTAKVPEAILTLNKTKRSVEMFTKKCQQMNCSRVTRRWEMSIFYFMVNIAVTNSLIVYLNQKIDQKKKAKSERVLTKFEFMVELHKQLAAPWQEERLDTSNISAELQTLVKKALGHSVEKVPAVIPVTRGARTTCYFCDAKKRRMTTTYCVICCRPICNEHSVRVCNDCCSS